jgi:hypothetical protein
MSDSDSSRSDLDINIDPDVAAAYNRGPDRVVHKGKQYLWRKHRDNTRAFSQPSVIWFLGDEYERTGNSRQKRFWRCGRCKGTTMLACGGGSSSGLRHLKKKHRIDKQGQQTATKQRTITSVLFAAATTVATLVPPNTLFHRHRPIRPVRLTGFQQARQAFPQA